MVTDEVRALASHTQQSTEHIQRMIAGLEEGVSQAINTIESGTSKVVNEVNSSGRIQSALTDMDEAVSQSNGLIYQIATASGEQSPVIDEQTAISPGGLSRKSVEIVSATDKVAEDIATMAKGLDSYVGGFKVHA